MEMVKLYYNRYDLRYDLSVISYFEKNHRRKLYKQEKMFKRVVEQYGSQKYGWFIFYIILSWKFLAVTASRINWEIVCGTNQFFNTLNYEQRISQV